MRILNLLLIAIVLTFTSCQNAAVPETAESHQSEECQVKDGLFLHISTGYDNPKKALMALSLATIMAETKDVALFLDMEGVKLLTKTSEDIQLENFISLHEALDKLIEMDVLIMACPMCTKAAGINPEDYKNGIIIAEKEKFFDFTKGRILSLDY